MVPFGCAASYGSRLAEAQTSRPPVHRSRWEFDQEDYDLLDVVNRTIFSDQEQRSLRRLFDPNLHPRGIKEMATPKSLRIASAMIDLLDALDRDRPEDRVRALYAVREEALHNGSGSLRRNVARVLLQLTKQLVRSRDDHEQQLRLAHDFREALKGNPRRIRRFLHELHLLEMPEEWNQLAFDYHVHDAHTKGRKSPTHLILDAWIKGIRELLVVYYNHIPPEAARELLEAAGVMGVQVKVGVEVSARFYRKYAQLVWIPRGFSDREDFLRFLDEPVIASFMAEGEEVSRFQETYVYGLLDSFNQNHLPTINQELELELQPIDAAKLRRYVGVGQAAVVHLAELIYQEALPLLRPRIARLELKRDLATSSEREQIDQQVARLLTALTPDQLMEQYLTAEANPEVPDPDVPSSRDDVPELLRYDVEQLLDRLETLRHSRITLNPSNLTAADVLEVLYRAEGRITHLEIFNLKDWAAHDTEHRGQIGRLRRTLNAGNLVAIKRVVRDLLEEVELGHDPDRDDRLHNLRSILRDLPRLRDFYREKHLASRLGSDSTGRARQGLGMGLVVTDTLPRRARRQLRDGSRTFVPVKTRARQVVTRVPRQSEHPKGDRFYNWLRGMPLINGLGYSRETAWQLEANATQMAVSGNICALGGLRQEGDLDTGGPAASPPRTFASPRYLNHGIKNLAKVLLGFLPAFLTFFLTKDWWVLAYLGAVIWFGITGIRNVVQSVVGGRGLFRRNLLRWNDFVSWSRVSDSLLFTGFSVPLLDYLVKSVILAGAFGITTTSNPLALYTFIALANGCYISSHNALRGLPPAAIFGNFFRTILSIPLAYGLNAGFLHLQLLGGASPEAALAALQLWAAVISKAASDVVAGFIEGYADRRDAARLRRLDYQTKLEQLFETYSRLEVLFPEEDVAELLTKPRELFDRVATIADDVVRAAIAHSLDLLYFWMYQPRGQPVLRRLMRRTNPEERRVIAGLQNILNRKRLISELFLDGFVGHDFERPLAFYLWRADGFRRSIDQLAEDPG